MQEEVRHGYALRPDLHVLVEALLSGGLEARHLFSLSSSLALRRCARPASSTWGCPCSRCWPRHAALSRSC